MAKPNRNGLPPGMFGGIPGHREWRLNPKAKRGAGWWSSPEYCTWLGMIARCCRPQHKSYPNYGGRGIEVCEAWLNFETFLIEMGPRPAGSTLDRIDPDGDYRLQNCRWVSRSVQERNKQKTSAVGMCWPKESWLKNVWRAIRGS